MSSEKDLGDELLRLGRKGGGEADGGAREEAAQAIRRAQKRVRLLLCVTIGLWVLVAAVFVLYHALFFKYAYPVMAGDYWELATKGAVDPSNLRECGPRCGLCESTSLTPPSSGGACSCSRRSRPLGSSRSRVARRSGRSRGPLPTSASNCADFRTSDAGAVGRPTQE